MGAFRGHADLDVKHCPHPVAVALVFTLPAALLIGDRDEVVDLWHWAQIAPSYSTRHSIRIQPSIAGVQPELTRDLQADRAGDRNDEWQAQRSKCECKTLRHTRFPAAQTMRRAPSKSRQGASFARDDGLISPGTAPRSTPSTLGRYRQPRPIRFWLNSAM